MQPETGKWKRDCSNNGKKRPTKVFRDLNSRLLRRAASEGKKSSDYGSDCDFEAMTDGGACGLDTWRGFKLVEGNTIDHQALVGIAESAWNEVKSKKKTNAGFVVAALFVPARGVFLGTPAHGAGTAQVRKWAPKHASTLRKTLDTRTLKEGRSGAL